MKKIADFLIQLGLSDIESRLYEGLLDYGASTVMEIADRLGMNRITAHANIKNLKAKGLVIESRNGARRLLIAEKPDRLGYFIEQKENDAKLLRSKFPDILKTIEVSFGNHSKKSGSDIKHYEGHTGVRAIYKDFIKYTEIRSYVNISKIFEQFPENPQLFPETIDKSGMILKEIIEDSEISRNYTNSLKDNKNYKYRFFPKDWDKDVFFDYMIADDKVAIITVEDSQPSGILIENYTIANNAKYIFDMIWSVLPKQS